MYIFYDTNLGIYSYNLNGLLVKHLTNGTIAFGVENNRKEEENEKR